MVGAADDVMVIDVSFGIPLFNEAINYSISNRMRQKKLLSGLFFLRV